MVFTNLFTRVANFLEMYGIEVGENEDTAITELMMDNHRCIEWKGQEYYIGEDISYSEPDQEIYDFLIGDIGMLVAIDDNDNLKIIYKDLEAWFEVDYDSDGELRFNWNQYIFHANDEEDNRRMHLQSNTEYFEAFCDVASNYMETKNKYNIMVIDLKDGYYAKKNGKYYAFEWSEDNKFYVYIGETVQEQNPNDYQIVQIHGGMEL